MKYIVGLLLFMGSTLPMFAQGLGGIDPENPPEPGDMGHMMKHKVEVVLGTPGAGTASGSGYYEYGKNITISASAVRGYKFVYWLKDSETEPYKTVASFTHTVEEDVKFTAIYERVKIVNAYISDEKAGKVTVQMRHNILGSEPASTTIGTGTSTAYTMPFYPYYSNSTTQTIYTKEEIGSAGAIKSIAYEVANTSVHNCDVKIYMGHKATNTFSSSSDYITGDKLTLVYSKSRTIAAEKGWEVFDLDVPFEYNGEDNLVVVVTRSSSTSTSSPRYYYTSANGRCLYRGSSSTSYSNVSTTGGYNTTSNRANTKFDLDRHTYGDKVEAMFSTTANKDYFLQYWLKNDETEPYSTEPSFVYPLADDEWEVSFTAIYKYVYNPDNPDEPGDIDHMVKHNVTVNINDERAGSVSGSGRYYYSDVVTIKTSGTVGYDFKGWLKDGQHYTNDKTFTYTVGTDDVVFTAEYVNTQEQLEEFGHAVYLTAEPVGSCTFTPESGTRYFPDDVYTVEAHPGHDWEFLGWYENGVKKDIDELSFSSYMGSEDITLVAKFVYNPDDPADPDNSEGYVDHVGTLGDVNGDDKVTVADAVSVIDYYLHWTESSDEDKKYDVNKDNKVTVADAVEVINIYLGK